jgi:hypothetical protein
VVQTLSLTMPTAQQLPRKFATRSALLAAKPSPSRLTSPTYPRPSNSSPRPRNTSASSILFLQTQVLSALVTSRMSPRKSSTVSSTSTLVVNSSLPEKPTNTSKLVVASSLWALSLAKQRVFPSTPSTPALRARSRPSPAAWPSVCLSSSCNINVYVANVSKTVVTRRSLSTASLQVVSRLTCTTPSAKNIFQAVRR